MRTPFLTAVLSLALGLMWQGQAVRAQQMDGYEPKAGDEAIVYIHKFNAQDYHRGKELVVEGFSEAISGAGQKRRTYYLENAATYEVMAISFFHEDESVHEWHSYAGRLDVLKELEPLRRAPLEVHHFRLIRSDSSP